MSSSLFIFPSFTALMISRSGRDFEQYRVLVQKNMMGFSGFFHTPLPVSILVTLLLDTGLSILRKWVLQYLFQSLEILSQVGCHFHFHCLCNVVYPYYTREAEKVWFIMWCCYLIWMNTANSAWNFTIIFSLQSVNLVQCHNFVIIWEI